MLIIYIIKKSYASKWAADSSEYLLNFITNDFD